MLCFYIQTELFLKIQRNVCIHDSVFIDSIIVCDLYLTKKNNGCFDKRNGVCMYGIVCDRCGMKLEDGNFKKLTYDKSPIPPGRLDYRICGCCDVREIHLCSGCAEVFEYFLEEKNRGM